MPIRMQCKNDECRKKFRVPDSAAGKRVRCPACDKIARAPAEVPDEPEEEEPSSEDAEAGQYSGRREAPGFARLFAIFCWFVVTMATLASIGLIGYTLFEVIQADQPGLFDADLKQAQDDWLIHEQPGALQTYEKALVDARSDAALDPDETRDKLVGGIAGVGVGAVLALLAFIAVLGQSRMRFVKELFVLCIFILPLLGIIGAGLGIGLTYFAMPNLRHAPQVKRLEERQRQAQTRGDHLESRMLRQVISEQSHPINNKQLLAGLLITAVSALVGIIAYISVPFCMAVLLYKLWWQVQDEEARASPGMALCGLFIPFFNMYWMLVAFPGLAHELNRCAAKQRVRVPPASVALMMTYCILGFLFFVPFLNILTTLIAIFVAISAFESATRVAEALANAAPEESAERRGITWPWYVLGSLIGTAAIAAGLAAFFLSAEALGVQEKTGNTVRRANEVTSTSMKQKYTATNPDADVVCLVRLNGTFPVATFNQIPREQRFAVAGGRRCEFMVSLASTTEGPFSEFAGRERIILVIIVPRRAEVVRLFLGNEPPIELALDGPIVEKIAFSE